jgi:endonuclease/exonuclease/phosphatase family metal-dependent hydrolase
VRIASFNVENLFDRARALTLPRAKASEILQQHARINELFAQPVYTDADKAEIKDLLKKLGLSKKDDGGKIALLRQVRGRLLRRPKSGGVEIVASGRASWVGWVELKTETVNERAMVHTAMVMRDVAADVLGVIEAENRIVLDKFSAQLLKKVGSTPYEHVMVIDGNDDRGIDVGILTRAGYPIEEIRSHVDDIDAKGEIFSRDCAEFLLGTPTGARITVLVNHFKSKGYGPPKESNEKRLRQATRVAQIYNQRRAEGEDNIVVIGDLNDTPDSAPLAPLLTQTDLRDIATNQHFTADLGRPGTYGNGTKSQKIDYVLLSPSLFDRVTGGAIFRTGVWAGKNGDIFPHYPTMTSPVHAASDHAALYADINI